MLYPLGVGECFLPKDIERLGGGVEIIKEPCVTEAWILGKRVVPLQPRHGGLDPRIIPREPRKDHALEAGVGHGGIAAQAPLRRCAGLALAAGGGRVVEAAIGIFLREWECIVRAREVLGARDKDQRPLDGRVVGIGAGGAQGLDEKGGVGEVGPVFLPISGATIGGIFRRCPLRLIPLQPLHKGLRASDIPIVAAVFVAGDQREQGDRRFVVGDGRALWMDAPIGLPEREQMGKAPLHAGLIDRRAAAHQGRHRQGRHGRAGRCHKAAVGCLPLLQEKSGTLGDRRPHRCRLGGSQGLSAEAQRHQGCENSESLAPEVSRRERGGRHG